MVSMRSASDEAIKALSEWADRSPWREHLAEYSSACLDEACEENGVERAQLGDLIGDDRLTPLWGCIFEQFAGMSWGEDESTIVDDYLKRRGWQRSAGAKRYLQALRDSSLSLWEVVGTTPGSHFETVDLIRGGPPKQVFDVLGSKSVHRWDRLLARVLPIGSRHELAGGVLLIEHQASGDLLDELRAMEKELHAEMRKEAKRRGADPPTLESMPAIALAFAQPLLIGFWLKRTLERLLAPPPRLVNTDGEDIEPCELRFPVLDSVAVGRILSLLDADPELGRHTPDEPRWSWIGPEQSSRRKSARKKAEAGRGDTLRLATYDERGIVLGSIEVRDQAVMLSVNSRARAERGRKLIAGLLGALVGEPSTTVHPLDIDFTKASRGAASLPPSGLSPEQEAEIIWLQMDDHYTRVLSEPVGALGGKTPRAAARTKSGRRQVAEWLKYMENQSSRAAAANPNMAYDFTWMWDELGITDLRR
jgi:hypothetical protein